MKLDIDELYAFINNGAIYNRSKHRILDLLSIL